MDFCRLHYVLFVIFIADAASGFAQTKGVTSGAIYTLISKSTNKVMDVSNASLADGATVDSWTNTGSDAQRWIITQTSKGIYTLFNVGSGKLLHIAAAPADKVHVIQDGSSSGTNGQWTIKSAGKGTFYLFPVADPKFSLGVNAGDTANGTAVSLYASSNGDTQKWVFQKETSQPVAHTEAATHKAFEDWATGYSVQTGKGFWDRAEMMEIVLDAYEVTKEEKYKTMFDSMYQHFVASNKSDWLYNKYNDDITWAVLFSVRGYLLTGNKTYLEKAKDQFDKMYARAFTNTFGGGLIWYETKTSKNACINGPAMVACCYLAQATGDSTYYNKAIALYSWSKLNLFNAATGKVYDNIDLNKSTGLIKTSFWSSTYNQGTYLGAATMLYKQTKERSYLDEAQKFAKYTRDSMYADKVMNNEDGGNDLPGFKGIFARYARMYAVETGKTDLNDWLLMNAKVAYNNRNSHGLIQTKWATRTGETKPKGDFGSSTAVSLLINVLPLKE
ncbi:MAG: glycoside hydrolase family 76 protein [Chitinophagaceae bacterium]